MIDINKAKIFYKEYISRYNMEDSKISLKVKHIYRTSEKAKKLAESMDLSKEDTKLAELIGLLHDIGRFEQIKKYNTFSDKDSVNHAELGIKILFKDGLITSFVEDRQYDNIIYKAILNHNKDKIEDGLNDRELLHAKIIRDADKLDIFYVILNEDIETVYGTENVLTKPITPEIFKQFIDNHVVNYKDMKQKNDLLIADLAFVFDINYIYTLKQIKENQYIEKMIKRFEFKNDILKNQIDIAYNLVKDYMNSKLK